MISIITIVKNDRRIEHLLNILQNYNNKSTEIIVVDASEGNLDDIKKKFLSVNWIAFKSKRRISIPEQRNEGIKNAKGDIIAFIDSDCIPQNNWLENLIYPIKKEKESIVAGAVIHSDTNSLHTHEMEKHKAKTYLGEAPTMNIAIKKRVFDKVGLFDENFQCGEDVDLLWRATNIGYKILYQQNAVVKHDLGTIAKELKRMYIYGIARSHLYNKHNDRQKYYWGNELLKIFYFFYLITLPFIIKYPWYITLLIIYIIKNHHNNPLKKFIYKSVYGAGMLYGLRYFVMPNNNRITHNT